MTDWFKIGFAIGSGATVGVLVVIFVIAVCMPANAAEKARRKIRP